MNNKRNHYIEFMRLIASIGVFNGHFLGIGIASEKSVAILRFLREGFIGKTLLAYLYKGDISVVFFFVVAGFFITYTFKNIDSFFDRLFSREFVLFASAVMITMFHSILCVLLDGKSTAFSHLLRCLSDISALFHGGELSYSYQLWFIYDLAISYMLIFAILGITRERKVLRILCFIVMIVCYYDRKVCYGEVIIGALMGEIVSLYDKKKKSDIACNSSAKIIVCISLLIGPSVYMTTDNDRAYILAVLFSLCIGSIMIAFDDPGNKAFFDNKYVVLAERNSFSFYLVHGFVLAFWGRVYDMMIVNGIVADSVGCLILFYILSVISAFVCAMIFSHIFVDHFKKIYAYAFDNFLSIKV